jgi:cytochrome c55X
MIKTTARSVGRGQRLGQRLGRVWLAGLLTCLGDLSAGSSGPGARLGGAEDSELLTRGRQALRAMDCARCHGRDHDGWAATSLIDAVRDGSPQRFATYVLDGDPGRGMPGYRSQPLVVDNLAAIYAYLRARARGDIAAGGRPVPAVPTLRNP